MDLIALRDLRYAGVSVKKDGRFDVPRDQDWRLLLATGAAAIVVDEKPAPKIASKVAVTEDEEQDEAGAKRRYKRKDLTAE